MAPAEPVAAVRMAMACGFRSPGVTCKSSESVGAPAPISTRVAINVVAFRRGHGRTARCGEDRETCDEYALATDAVAERAGGDEQTAEEEDLGVDDPQQPAGAWVQPAAAELR